jgi:hypothetical protein
MKRVCIAAVGVILLLAVGSAQAPKPGPELRKLDFWNGNWTYETEYKASPVGPAGKATGRTVVKMAVAGFAQLYTWTEKGTTGALEGLQVLTYDPVAKTYVFNNWDSTGAITSGTGTVAGNTWTWKGTLIAGDKQYAMRGTDVISDDLKTDIYTVEVSADGGKTWATVLVSTNRKGAGGIVG